MKERNFTEDLTAVLSKCNYDSKNIKFPIKITKKQEETEVSILELSKRSANVLGRGGIKNIRDIINNYSTMYEIRGGGETTIKEIKNKFLKWWYNSLEDEEINKFWLDFMKVNKIS